jgi:hypothetical protein
MTDAPLTPAEAFVLLNPVPNNLETFKIELLSLIAMGVLRIETIKSRPIFLLRLFGVQGVPHQVVSVVRDPPAIFLAAETVDIVRNAGLARGSEHGRNFLSVALSAHKILGPYLWKLYAELICPALAARGWLEPQEEKNHPMAGGRYMHYRHTPAGLAEKQRIDALLDRARLLPSLIDTNPAEAKAIVLETGSLVLLVPELKPIYGKLTALDAGALHFGNLDASVLDAAFDYFTAFFDGRFSTVD